MSNRRQEGIGRDTATATPQPEAANTYHAKDILIRRPFKNCSMKMRKSHIMNYAQELRCMEGHLDLDSGGESCDDFAREN